MNNFTVINYEKIKDWIKNNTNEVIDSVEKAYLSFSKKEAICPNSYFLKYPNEPANRIIALPGSIESKDLKVSGIKWISSFPDNINHNLDRASAILILNDRKTGYPVACLEGSIISAYRTAASAIIGATYLHNKDKIIDNISIVGGGLISYTILSLFIMLGWEIKKVTIIDKDIDRAIYLSKKFSSLEVECSSDIKLIRSSDMIVFATSAISPHIEQKELFSHNPTILHMSLRDISPEIIIESQNFTDDINHALQADTSLHLAEKKLRNRRFMAGSAIDLISLDAKPNFNQTRIWSPFGMGILDIAVGFRIFESLKENESIKVNNFFPDPYVMA